MMSKHLISLEILALIFASHGYASDVLPALNSVNLVGHYTDELPKSSEVGRFTQPLLSNPKMALEYRIEGKQEYVLLLDSQEKGSRWKIVDSMKVPKHSSKESISFACSPAGGPPPDAGAGALAIVPIGKESQKVAAVRAWKVNLEKKKLEPIQGKKTICDLRGVD